jgi:hypothetical protein
MSNRPLKDAVTAAVAIAMSVMLVLLLGLYLDVIHLSGAAW